MIFKKKAIGFHRLSKILDTFPLATEIVVGKGDYRLVTPPRLLTDSPYNHQTRPTQLHVKASLKSGNDIALLERAGPNFRCDIVYEINIGPDCQIDWDLSLWCSTWTARTSTFIGPRTLLFDRIYHREILNMTIDQPIDLDILSTHLERRRQLGRGEIKIGICEWSLAQYYLDS